MGDRFVRVKLAAFAAGSPTGGIHLPTPKSSGAAGDRLSAQTMLSMRGLGDAANEIGVKESVMTRRDNSFGTSMICAEYEIE